MTEAKPESSGEIAFLLYPGCQLGMVYGMTEMLELANTVSVARGSGSIMRLSHWQADPEGEVVRTFDTAPESNCKINALVVPGRLSGPVSTDEAAAYIPWLSQMHENGVTLTSACVGAFLLAETGLLAGRQATTHWYFRDSFEMRFPEVALDTDRIMIEDGNFITAGGLMAWTDLAMRIIDRRLGAAVMIRTARFFLVDSSGREQRFYSSFEPRLTHGDTPILNVQRWLQETNLGTPTISEMAQRASLEERTFLRRLKAATGMNPAEYVRHLKMGRARELLQFTRQSI